MAWEARGLSEEVSEDKERGIRTEENYNSYRVQAHLLTTWKTPELNGGVLQHRKKWYWTLVFW